MVKRRYALALFKKRPMINIGITRIEPIRPKEAQGFDIIKREGN
jgi:hypothetical protein